MLQVTIPPAFFPERMYLLRTLLGDFLGLDYEVHVEDRPDWLLRLDNGKKLVVQDHFFIRCQEPNGYLRPSLIPQKVNVARLPFLAEEEIPVIYGTEELSVTPERIDCGLDLFASSFFLLTRWEEAVLTARDGHERFPASASLAGRCGFLHRPVVNEYLEMLWNMLVYLGIQQPRRERRFRLVLTHDVDFLYLWRSPQEMLRTLAGDVLKRRDLKRAAETVKRIAGMWLGNEKDPYDTFDWLMEVSERYDVQSRFYWMSGGVSEHDNFFRIEEERAVRLLREMQQRGHEIGFHPSYGSYRDAKQWKAERDALERVAGARVTEGRQHYLRFAVPQTWQIWEDAGMKADSTLYFAEQAGFRTGVCHEHPLFNVQTREMLELRELPLTAMELTFLDPKYNESPNERIFDEIIALADQCRKYHGDFVLLWHNSSLITKQQRALYQQVVQALATREQNESILQEIAT